jgi:predicted RNA-binding Zn ribbon-like protein
LNRLGFPDCHEATDARPSFAKPTKVVTYAFVISKGLPMAEQLPPPMFVADAVGLDFLNTLAVPVDTQVEWLGSGNELIAWLEAAELVPPEALAALRKTAVPGEFDAVASQARKLREWFRGFIIAHMGKPLRPKALQELVRLNRILSRDEEFGQVVAREVSKKGSAKGDPHEGNSPGLVWSLQRRWRSPDSLLFPIAKSMAEVVCEEDFSLIRACEGHKCTIIFLDRTRGHARRWCRMAVCGNRAKQAAHRERALRG